MQVTKECLSSPWSTAQNQDPIGFLMRIPLFIKGSQTVPFWDRPTRESKGKRRWGRICSFRSMIDQGGTGDPPRRAYRASY